MNRRRLLMFSQKDFESLAYDKWTNPPSSTIGSIILGDLGKLYCDYYQSDTQTALNIYNDINKSNPTEDYLIAGVCTTLGFHGHFGSGSWYQVIYIDNPSYSVLKYGYCLWYVKTGRPFADFMEGAGLVSPRNDYLRIEHIPTNGYTLNDPKCDLSTIYAIKRLDFENYLTSTFLGEV